MLFLHETEQLKFLLDKIKHNILNSHESLLAYSTHHTTTMYSLSQSQSTVFYVLILLIFEAEFQKVMSLRDGKQKMSKSNPVDATRINLDDSPELIQQKIRYGLKDMKLT